MAEIKIKPECREALTKLYEYIDGEITAVDRDKVRAHLEICRPCLTYFEFERLFHEYVCTKAPRPTAREEFKTGLLQRIRAEGASPQSGAGSTIRLMPRFALAASIALLVLVGSWFLSRQQASTVGGADWQLLADYHNHRQEFTEELSDINDAAVALEFVSAHMGPRTGELVPATPPGGMRFREVGIASFKASQIAMVEWECPVKGCVSLFLARSSCLPICSKPQLKLHGRTYHVVTTNGLNAVCWEADGGYVCAMIAPRDFSQMLALAEEVRGPGGF
jgi:mycothiol system anti-sigma-R factor